MAIVNNVFMILVLEAINKLFLAYFYPRVAVMDDVHGWDKMNFTDAQEFYNDFNDLFTRLTISAKFHDN